MKRRIMSNSIQAVEGTVDMTEERRSQHSAGGAVSTAQVQG